MKGNQLFLRVFRFNFLNENWPQHVWNRRRLFKQARTCYKQTVTVFDSLWISGIYFSLIFLWFGSNFELSNRQIPAYKQASTYFKTSARLIQTVACLNGTSGRYLKTAVPLFLSRQAPCSKQVAVCFKEVTPVSNKKSRPEWFCRLEFQQIKK